MCGCVGAVCSVRSDEPLIIITTVAYAQARGAAGAGVPVAGGGGRVA